MFVCRYIKIYKCVSINVNILTVTKQLKLNSRMNENIIGAPKMQNNFWCTIK